MVKLIVFGNEKGGTGKSTSAILVMIYLLQRGEKVGVIDLDIRQKTLSQFLENRNLYSRNMNLDIDMPEIGVVKEYLSDSKSLTYKKEVDSLNKLITELKSTSDYILIDCPGFNSNLSVRAHEMADLIVTPINDSFIDFDLLGRLDPSSKRIKYASIYSEMIWNARKHRIASDQTSQDWVVLSNRTNHLKSKNKNQLDKSILELSKRCGFKIVSGFSERNIFRELFVLGLTPLDVSTISGWKFTVSHINARNEIRNLMKGLNI